MEVSQDASEQIEPIYQIRGSVHPNGYRRSSIRKDSETAERFGD